MGAMPDGVQGPTAWPWAIAGLSLLVPTLIGWAPAGPWSDPTFSIGRWGCSEGVLSTSWFRWTFRTEGILPRLELWDDPERTWWHPGALGMVLLISAPIGRVEALPGTTGLLLGLIGSLAILVSLHAGLAVSLLAEEE